MKQIYRLYELALPYVLLCLAFIVPPIAYDMDFEKINDSLGNEYFLLVLIGYMVMVFLMDMIGVVRIRDMGGEIIYSLSRNNVILRYIATCILFFIFWLLINTVYWKVIVFGWVIANGLFPRLVRSSVYETEEGFICFGRLYLYNRINSVTESTSGDISLEIGGKDHKLTNLNSNTKHCIMTLLYNEWKLH